MSGQLRCSDKFMDNNETCRCGKPMRPHCPECGSLRKYGFANRYDTETMPDGRVLRYRVYRCLTCARTYNDNEWQFRCGAPQQQTGRPPAARSKASLAQQQQADAIRDQGLDAAPLALLEKIEQYRKKGYGSE